MKRTVFLWDKRPGFNVDHIRSHGMTTNLWEVVFHHAHLRQPDKDDSSIFSAEGRAEGRLFRIVFGVDDEIIIPLSIIPITGFPIARRGLRRSPT